MDNIGYVGIRMIIGNPQFLMSIEHRKARVTLNRKAIREDNWNIYPLIYLDLVVSWCDIMAYHGISWHIMAYHGTAVKEYNLVSC